MFHYLITLSQHRAVITILSEATALFGNRREKTMAKLFIRLIGAAIGSAPYVAALWMIMNGYNW